MKAKLDVLTQKHRENEANKRKIEQEIKKLRGKNEEILGEYLREQKMRLKLEEIIW